MSTDDVGALDETAMRAATVPWLDSEDALITYVHALVERTHDYGTCVYAMSMAATAAFQYVAGKLGVSGFQASCADMDILRRTRHMEDGFRILNYADLLYPQYFNSEHFPSAQDILRANPDLHRKLAEKAKANLATDSGVDVVRNHWKWLVTSAPGEQA